MPSCASSGVILWVSSVHGEPVRRVATKLIWGSGFKTTEMTGLMRIPPGKESQHFQMMGDTGAGKTTLIMQLLRQIRDRGDVAIVYDPASEFVQRFYDEKRGDIILNPLDARCPFWSPAMEIESNQEATTISESLYQPSGGSSNSSNKEFFYRTPAQIFAHLLREGPTPHTLAEWMADESFLQKKVKGTEMAFYIDRKAGPQAAGVLASLGLVAQSLRLLPKEGRNHVDLERHGLGQEARGLDLHYLQEVPARGAAPSHFALDRHPRDALDGDSKAGPKAGLVCDRRAGQPAETSPAPQRHDREPEV